MPHDLDFLHSIDKDFGCCGTSAVDTSDGIIKGRPYGGVALLWRKSVFPNVARVECENPRIVAARIELSCTGGGGGDGCAIGCREALLCSVYMPTDSHENLLEFTECLGTLEALCECSAVQAVYMLGDYNAHPGELFSSELSCFCDEHDWICVDEKFLEKETFTYLSDAHGTTRWLDHCVVTKAALLTITDVKILNDVFWSDHFPVVVNCNINIISNIIEFSNDDDKFKKNIKWGRRNELQIELYKKYCTENLKNIVISKNICEGCDKFCDNSSHFYIIDNKYNEIINILQNGAIHSFEASERSSRGGKQLAGWNYYVRESHQNARLKFQVWLNSNKPNHGNMYDEMCCARRKFKSALKWCQKNQERIKMNIITKHRIDKNFVKFWQATKTLGSKPTLPLSVNGVSEPKAIAERFRDHFTVQVASDGSTGGDSAAGATVARAEAGEHHSRTVYFTENCVWAAVRSMSRGKSPGHDALSIEHIQHAGPEL